MASEQIRPDPPPSPITPGRPLAPFDLPGDEEVGPTGEERILAVLCHVGGYFTWFLMPLIFWLVMRRQSRFLDHHGKEALNFQLFLTPPYLLLTVALCVIGTLGITGYWPRTTTWTWFLVCGAITGVFFVYETVLVILAVAASAAGRYFRYPLVVRIIR